MDDDNNNGKKEDRSKGRCYCWHIWRILGWCYCCGHCEHCCSKGCECYRCKHVEEEVMMKEYIDTNMIDRHGRRVKHP